MLSGALLGTISLAYLGLLFFIAWWFDRRGEQSERRPWVYALSLAVYCTSWTFFGAVGAAAGNGGWSWLPIYLGPFIMFAVFWPLYERLIRVCHEQNITSLADFFARRYGQGRWITVTVALIALFGGMPYIALQLKAVAQSYQVVTGSPIGGVAGETSALVVALLMAFFAILFGTRHLDPRESHRGMVYAIAFESIIKLAALTLVGLFVVYGLFDGFGDLAERVRTSPEVAPSFGLQGMGSSFMTQVVLAMAAVLCLPRQFQVTVVENSDYRDLHTARWLFPLYMVLISIFIAPIAAAGLLREVSAGDPDTWVMTLPLAEGQPALAMMAFIGGLSAATGMVIVASIALSTMLCNDLVMPLLLRTHWLRERGDRELATVVISVRRLTIPAILLLAFGYYRLVGDSAALASFGLLSFAAAVQFAPGIIAGLYWPAIRARGVLAGLVMGFGTWFYTLALPNLTGAGALQAPWLTSGPFGLDWLRPQALFGVEGMDPLTHGVMMSLALNVLLMLGLSLGRQKDQPHRALGTAFVVHDDAPVDAASPTMHHITVDDLMRLLERVLGRSRAGRVLAEYQNSQKLPVGRNESVPEPLLKLAERSLAGLLGAATAQLVMNRALGSTAVGMQEFTEIMGETAGVLRFNQDVLQTTLDNISQGVSVVDEDLRMVAWSQAYLDMFDYPPGMIYVGQPVQEIIRFNAERGFCGPGEVEQHVARRVAHLRAGQPYTYERVRSDGVVIESHGNPMPGGGFVTSFSDVTAHKQTAAALREAKGDLERRVAERTEQAHQAKHEAEAANQSKTRFIASASHDLRQPLNAARLFAAALRQRSSEADIHDTLENIEESLESAEGMLNALLDVSRLESGSMPVDLHVFPVADVLNRMKTEFAALANERGLIFRMRPCALYVRSDPRLLRRVLQNYLTNAFRYTTEGGVLLGCRRRGDYLRIDVWDTGPGIEHSHFEEIFQEFSRLQPSDPAGRKSLGLGLAIVRRITALMNHRVSVHSVPGHGSRFSVSVPLGDASEARRKSDKPALSSQASLEGLSILCLDNDEQVLGGMQELLSGWGCQPLLARNYGEAIAIAEQAPDLMMIDYRLDHGVLGTEVYKRLCKDWGREVPAIVISADTGEDVRRAAAELHCELLLKPLRPAALRALINQLRR